MNYRIIDMEHYHRREHFNYYRSLAYPYAGITADVDVTELYNYCKDCECSFTLAFLHAAALAADKVPEFRRRILNGKIIEYENCPTSHIEMREDESICYCTLHHDMPWKEYIVYAQNQQQLARSGGVFQEDDEVLGYYFVSIIPWLHYSALLQPAACGDESNPRITWGKFKQDNNGRLKLPLSILAHHALVDGIHIARFYENISEEMKKIRNKK